MTDRQAEYIHIKDVLLDAEEDDHPISIALRANNATTIRGLNRLAGSPAEIEALTWTDPSDGMEKPLPIDSKEDLMGIPSYRNFLHSRTNTGPSAPPARSTSPARPA